MAKKLFEPKYTEEDFLYALKDTPKTIGYLSRLVGCARQTTVTYMKKLVEKGKVVKESVDDGALFIYRLA
jgi:predicted transcriptional regulator